MKLYRFSPIKNQQELIEAVTHIHVECYKMCKNSFGEYLPNAENIGIFCHYDQEYEILTKLREEMTESSTNWNQKYFTLHNPIVIPEINNIPGATYKYLYIRKPDPYRHHVGDIDFFLPKNNYKKLKEEILAGKSIKGIRIFSSPTLDMIELYNPDTDVLGYISDEMMVDLVKNTYSQS